MSLSYCDTTAIATIPRRTGITFSHPYLITKKNWGFYRLPLKLILMVWPSPWFLYCSRLLVISILLLVLSHLLRKLLTLAFLVVLTCSVLMLPVFSLIFFLMRQLMLFWIASLVKLMLLASIAGPIIGLILRTFLNLLSKIITSF